MDILLVILGFLAGLIVSYNLRNLKTYGTLEIDMTDKDNPYYRLMLSQEDFEEIPKHSTVLLRVRADSKFASNKQFL